MNVTSARGFLLISVFVAVFGGVWLVFDHDSALSPFLGVVGLLGFAGIVSGLFVLAPFGELHRSREDFTVRTVWRTRVIPRADVERIVVFERFFLPTRSGGGSAATRVVFVGASGVLARVSPRPGDLYGAVLVPEPEHIREKVTPDQAHRLLPGSATRAELSVFPLSILAILVALGVIGWAVWRAAVG